MTLLEMKKKVLRLIEEINPNSELLTDDPDIANKINDAKFISLKKYRNFIDDFIIALLLHISKSVKIDNKSDLMYAYNLASNILHLFGIQNFATNFDKEKDKYFEEALNAFVELHTNNEANVG